MDSGSLQAGLCPPARSRRATKALYATARHTPRAEHQSIDDMLREGQEVLVQVAKEPIGKKGARVTSHIALPGRYLVYMPTVEHVGVSRKIGSDAERIRLKDIILKHRDRFPGGVIVRTAAEEHSEEDLVNDLNFLVRLWEDMRTKAEKVSAPALIHAEMNLVQRLLRDQFSFEFAAIRVDDEMEYQRIVEFVDKIFPNLVHRVKLYTKESYIFDEYGITPEIDKLLQPKIWLKSGGYIVINQTEALVSIDINTGKFVGRGNSLEETITRTNLEAVKEIVRQIRLRDLGGIIVIDFIDMDERKNRKRVMEALSEEIARDKSPSKILEFNEFGLVAITRKRVKQSLERTLCQPCPYCTGSGMVKSVATTCYSIYHEIEKMRDYVDERSELMIRVHPDVARALRESESNVMDEIRHLLRAGCDHQGRSDPAHRALQYRYLSRLVAGRRSQVSSRRLLMRSSYLQPVTILDAVLRFFPERIHFGERGVFQLASLALDRRFEIAEAALEFSVASAQGRLRIDAQESGNICGHKKQISDFIGHLLEVLPGLRLPKFRRFLRQFSSEYPLSASSQIQPWKLWRSSGVPGAGRAASRGFRPRSDLSESGCEDDGTPFLGRLDILPVFEHIPGGFADRRLRKYADAGAPSFRGSGR